MYPLLIVREEFVCLIILLFMLVSSRFYKMGKDEGSFTRLSGYAIGHVVFDIITVNSVNSDTINPILNNLFHICFYIFAILFAYEFFCYICEICISRSASRKFRQYGISLPAAFLLACPFLKIEYIQANGTRSSYGPAAFVGYGIALAFLIASIAMTLINFKKLQPSQKWAILPMLLAMIVAELLQIAIPELLFTGGAITLITVAFFFSLENPASVFQRKAYTDAMTGVKSRHSYEADIKEIQKAYSADNKLSFSLLFFDINDLKSVNDTYGHPEGDTYISCVANILIQNLKNCDNIYRVGGDEFLAIYKNISTDTIEKEILAVEDACTIESEKHKYEISVASGYASTGEKYKTIYDVIRIADYLMYSKKAEMKKMRAFSDSFDGKLNISGLTDRLFEAFSESGNRSYPFVCNMETDVSRLSPNWVKEFNLPGEFVPDFRSLWAQKIHPDDRQAFLNDTQAVFKGDKRYHDLEYRVMDKDGKYVVCTGKGSILHGKNGEPTLFAGFMVNHSIVESIDAVTGLHNDHVFMNNLNGLIENHTPTVILKIGTISFSRINMIYGRENGNMILEKFAKCIQDVLDGKHEVYRIEGTKFGICLTDTTTEKAKEIYARIKQHASTDITINDQLVPIEIACGAYVLDSEFTGNIGSLLGNLIYAFEQSKFEEQGKLVFFTESSAANDTADYELLSSIHNATAGNKEGFFLRYQPILDVDTRHIKGSEALIRWKSDTFGEVQPNRFIPWLENDPCFYDLGLWIIRKALEDTMPILKDIPDYVVNVNITMQQLLRNSFITDVLEILARTGFPTCNLCLELTERCRDIDLTELKDRLNEFRRKGIKIALDDVGTGSASLTLMLNLPLTEIKLDKRFVSDLPTNAPSQLLVKSLFDMSKTMNYTICFEGIENEETYQYLRRYQGTLYQGYFYSKPLLLEDLMANL